MKTFQSPKKYTLDTLFPGGTLTLSRVGSFAGRTYTYVGKGRAPGYPLKLRDNITGVVSDHLIYNYRHESFWEELDV